MYPYVPDDWDGTLLLIGEGPGEDEDENSGRPFTGKAGKLLKKLYSQSGYRESSIALVNTVRCRMRNNGKPSMAQIRACRPFILKTIQALNPKYILGLGGIALRSITNNGDANVTKARGKRLSIPGLEKSPLTYVTYHPASVLWGSYQNEKRIVEDFKRYRSRAIQASRHGFPISSCIGFDTEYDSKGNLLTAGFSDDANAIAIETTEKTWLQEAKKCLRKVEILSGHSVAGDLDYLVKYKLAKTDWLKGLKLRDSFLLARMVDENRGKGAYGLQPLLLSDYNFDSWKGETEKLLKKTGNAADWAPEQRTDRCKTDAWATFILADSYSKKVPEKLSELTHRIALALHRVGLAGAAVNLNRFHRLGKKWTQEASVRGDLLSRSALRLGMKQFTSTNDNHVRELLYKKLNCPVLEKTPSGLPSVSKPILNRLLLEHQDLSIIRDLIKFNQVDKLSSTWYGRQGVEEKSNRKESVANLIKSIPGNKHLGLLHFWVFPLRARTGRRTSGGSEEGDPVSRNSQNWPSTARKVIVSRWKWGKIAICDFVSLEVVLMGWRANDGKLLDYFLNGGGYVDVAKEFWGQAVKKDTPLYKATKSLVLGLNYNMGWYKLALDLWHKAGFRFSEDWDEHVKKTKRARKRYLKMFPGLRSYIRSRIHEVTRTKQVVSPSGRIRHLEHHGPESEGFWHLKNSAVNFPIQSFASDITGSAIVDYEDTLLREHKLSFFDWHSALLNTPWNPPASPVFNEVHDELDLDLHPKSGKCDLEILVDCMRNVRTLKKIVPEFNLTLKVDVKERDAWE